MSALAFPVVVIAIFDSAPRFPCVRGGSTGSSDLLTAVITSDGEMETEPDVQTSLLNSSHTLKSGAASHYEESDLRNVSDAPERSKVIQDIETDERLSASSKSTTNAGRSSVHGVANSSPTKRRLTPAEQLWEKFFGGGNSISFSQYYTGMLRVVGLDGQGGLVNLDVEKLQKINEFTRQSFADALPPDIRDSATIWEDVVLDGVSSQVPTLSRESFNKDGMELSFHEFQKLVSEIMEFKSEFKTS